MTRRRSARSNCTRVRGARVRCTTHARMPFERSVMAAGNAPRSASGSQTECRCDAEMNCVATRLALVVQSAKDPRPIAQDRAGPEYRESGEAAPETLARVAYDQ